MSEKKPEAGRKLIDILRELEVNSPGGLAGLLAPQEQPLQYAELPRYTRKFLESITEEDTINGRRFLTSLRYFNVAFWLFKWFVAAIIASFSAIGAVIAFGKANVDVLKTILGFGGVH